MGVSLFGPEGLILHSFGGNDVKEGIFWDFFNHASCSGGITDQYVLSSIKLFDHEVLTAFQGFDLITEVPQFINPPTSVQIAHEVFTWLHDFLNLHTIHGNNLIVNDICFPFFMGNGSNFSSIYYRPLEMIAGVGYQQFISLILERSGIREEQFVGSGLGDGELDVYRTGSLFAGVFVDQFLSSVLISSGVSISQSLGLSLGVSERVFVQNDIISGLFERYYLGNNLSEDPFSKCHYMGLDLSTYSFTTMHYILNDIEPQVPSGMDPDTDASFLWYATHGAVDDTLILRLPSATLASRILFKVFIDGIECQDKITEVRIPQNESEILSQVEIIFKDPSFFSQCAITNGTGPGTVRIVIRIGSDFETNYTDWVFVLEERSASESGLQFTVWGRNPACVLNEPFCEKLTQTYEYRLASDIAQDLAGLITVDWKVDDHLYCEFNIDDYPLNGIQQLAEAIGAIVRSTPDGNLEVRYKFPVRPKDLINRENLKEEPAATLDRYSQIVEADYSEEQPQYNSVEVMGGSCVSSYEFSIEALETCVPPGTPAELHIYHADGITIDDYRLCASFPVKDEILEPNVEETLEEYVDISNGTGSLSHDSFRILTYSWHGTPKGDFCETPSDIEITFDGKEVTVENVLTGRLFVSYITRYDKYTFTHGNEGDEIDNELLISLLAPEHEGVYVNVIIAGTDGDKPASPIQDDLILHDHMAILRGTSFLDDTYYRKHKWSIKIPFYKSFGLKDGDIVILEDDFWGITGWGIVRQADIELVLEDNVFKVWQKIDVHTYSKP